jgi:hypothetical protein
MTSAPSPQCFSHHDTECNNSFVAHGGALHPQQWSHTLRFRRAWDRVMIQRLAGFKEFSSLHL